MVGLHFAFHYNSFAAFQIGWFAVMKNYFCFSSKAVDGIKRKIIGIVYRIVNNGFRFIQFGNKMYKFTRFCFSRVNGIVG